MSLKEKRFQVIGSFFVGNVQGHPFCPPKKPKSTKQSFCFTGNLRKFVKNSRCLDYSELLNILPGAGNDELPAKRTEKCKIFCNLLEEGVENLEDHGCPKIQDLAETDDEMWICSCYPVRGKTTFRCSEGKEKLFGKWRMHHLKL